MMGYYDAKNSIDATWESTITTWDWPDPEGHKASHGTAFLGADWLIDCAKLTHYLLAPEEIDQEEFLAWLPPPGGVAGR